MNFKKYFFIIIISIFHSAAYSSFDSLNSTSSYPTDSQTVAPTNSNNGEGSVTIGRDIHAEIYNRAVKPEERFHEQSLKEYYLPPRRNFDNCPESVLWVSIMCCWWPCYLCWGMQPQDSEK